MDPTHQSTTSRQTSISSNLCYELIQDIQSHLPRYCIDGLPDHEDIRLMMCSGVSKNWLIVSRQFAFWDVNLGEEDEAVRYLAAFQSNDAFIEQNPGWPRMNSTRALTLGNVCGMSPIT